MTTESRIRRSADAAMFACSPAGAYRHGSSWPGVLDEAGVPRRIGGCG